jgi:hypothetical protein
MVAGVAVNNSRLDVSTMRAEGVNFPHPGKLKRKGKIMKFRNCLDKNEFSEKNVAKSPCG